MPAITLNQYTVYKDKDARVSKVVAPYEAKLLQFIFGAEHVKLEAEGVATMEVDAGGEEERLCMGYGAPVVQECFGKEPGRIAELVEQAAARAPARSKKKADAPEADAAA